MVLIFLIAAIAGALVDNQFAQMVPLSFASIYILVIGPGAFTGGGELDKDELNKKLSEKWRNSQEIADFIHKYWYSIKYVMSAQKRGANCSFISLASFALSGWYFYSEFPIWLAIWSCANGIILWPIGNKVNKALFILYHERGTPQWQTACVSFVALSEILENENYSYLVNNVLPQDQVAEAIEAYKLK